MKILLSAFALMAFASAQAQDVKWDKDKYPDYNPVLRINRAQQLRMANNIQKQKEAGKTRPDHVNNALTSAFPPVMNQSAGSCGSASRIYYMFAHEMNAARWADGSKAENIYPTHFTWLLTWCPNGQGKEDIAKHNGVPNSVVYGGYTYSDLFGYQDCDSQSDYGWMQGYEKWLHAMNNRISGSANFPAVNTEEGRELVKNWLWNHCGDETFSCGGICGVGVASSGTWKTIPNTATNKSLGVNGMYYVQNWGSSVDHALTIVGYDDRIEFDLDGNGVKGEESNSKGQNEKGAWIIVNSWGTGFCNGGFVYCPYAEARPTATASDYWGPEYYIARRDYRPLRTIKVKMDYDHRSEIALYVGVSKNLNATKPDKETWLRHFNYAGLGKGVTVNASNPDPAVPMLGRWADGKMHDEPMEFGYDLTDLVSEYENGQPLKYFLRIETRSWAAGSGKIYAASIYDYATDRDGVETPFEIEEEGVSIQNAGAKTTITTTARGEKIPAPRNLNVADGQLTWEAPLDAAYPVNTYNIYKDGELLTNVSGTTFSTAIEDYGMYTISAVYQAGEYEIEGWQSPGIFGGNAPETFENTFLNINDGQFTVPGFTSGGQDEYTIEFWVKPTSFDDYSFGIKASSGKFLFYINKNGYVVAGFDGGDFGTGTTALTTNSWQHIAIVVKKTNITVYRTTGTATKTTTSIFSKTSDYSNSGISGSNDLWFGRTEGTGSGSSNYKQVINAPWNGAIDELHIWNYARTQTEIKNACADTYFRLADYPRLTHYYNMATCTNSEDHLVLIDSKGSHNVTLTNGTFETSTNAYTEHPHRLMSKNAAITVSNTKPIVGEAVTLSDTGSPSNVSWNWTITGSETTESSSSSPVVVFNAPGQQTITLSTSNIKGGTGSATKTITVVEAEAPVADFRLPEGQLAAGDHLTFINTSTPLDNATYKWTLEGAEVEMLNTMNAAATYPANGIYTVRLEATTAAGTSSVEKQIEIVKVAPKAAFTIQNNVVLKGEKVNLIDNSRYEPSKWNWLISNSSYTYLAECQSGSVSFDRPGTYDVTLTAANEVGSNSLTRERAIVVCNADGHTGLAFDNADDELVAGSPITSTLETMRFTVEWWMFPGFITGTNCAIGDAASTFLLTVGEDLAMTVSIKNKTAKSYPSFVVENEWHHYAVTYSSSNSKVIFYRDGKLFTEVSLSGYTKWNSFRMGGSEAPMNAIVDELRVWKKTLTKEELQSVINAPIEDPANNSNLVLYYDFNQSTGDVVDKASKNLTGVRSNFGPDGDAWSNSKGIFCLNFDDNSADVSSTYLKNYTAPFTYGSGYIQGSSRFHKLGNPWVQENSVVDGNVTTEFYVDENKNNYLTLSTTWDGFASAVPNLKLYQAVTLPAGAYELLSGTTRLNENNPSANYLVAAEGVGLPDFNMLSKDALGYAPSNQTTPTCKFTLTEEKQVSLGIVSSQNGQSCHTIMGFALYYTPLSVLEPGEIEVAIETVEDELQAVPKVEAIGGFGAINITVSEPQRVDVFDLTGKLIWSSFVEKKAVVPVRKGLYIAGRQKVLVR